MKVGWKTTIATGALLMIVVALGGTAAAQMSRAAAAITFLVLGTQMVRANRGRSSRPWLYVVAGAALALTSALVRWVHGAQVGDLYVYPSPADILGYLSYVLFIAGCVAAVRSRTIERDTPNAVDSLIAALVAGLVLYTVVLSDYVADESMPLTDRIGNLTYSVLTVALIGVVVRVWFGPGVRNGSYYLMAWASIGVVLNDVLLLAGNSGQAYAFDAAAFVAPASFMLAAAAVQHPGALLLTERPEYSDRTLSRGRLVFLLFALAIGPMLLLNPVWRDSALDRTVIISTTAALVLGVFARMAFVALDWEHSARREGELRGLAARFSAMTQPETVIAASLRAALDVTANGAASTAVIYERDSLARFVVAAASGKSSRQISDLEVADAETSKFLDACLVEDGVRSAEEVKSFYNKAIDGGSGVYFVVAAPIARRGGDSAVLVVTSPRLIRREREMAIASIATQLGLALDGLSAAERAHQARSDRRFRALVENSSDVVIVIDDDESIGFVSPTVDRLLGRAETDLIGQPLMDLVFDPDCSQLEQLLDSPASASGSAMSVEARLLHANGNRQWFEIEARDISHESEVGGVVVTARDISDRRMAEANLLRSEARFRLMVQHSHDIVAVINDDDLITYVSPSVERILMLSVEDLLGHSVFDLLSVTESERLRRALFAMDPAAFEVFVQGGDGLVHALDVKATDMRSQPEVQGTVLAMRDVTERKSLERDLLHQAQHDHLTGLANRVAFSRAVTEALHLAPANRAISPMSPACGQRPVVGTQGQSLTGVLFVDLDGFKVINDSLGHIAGDQVLVVVADRIRETLRASDRAARLGGDEFGVLVTHAATVEQITRVADRLREALARPVRVGKHQFRLTASIGIVVEVDEGRGCEDLLRAADLAMYEAKQAGRDQWALFEPQMEVSAAEELFLKSSLSLAMDRDEFVLHYQPIVDLDSGTIVGAEALVRWHDPKRGLISPALFIPAAEESGLICDIGRWVASRAANDLAEWRLAGHDLYCSINVSGRQISDADFADEFVDLITTTVDPACVVVELTESVLADPGTRDVFERLADNGIRVALDDFGTGYSALSYLQSFPIDLIKIDRAFVSRLGTTRDSGLVQAILDVASSIGATTIAEGIEDGREMKILQDLGVGLGQGYHFARPIDSVEFAKLLHDHAELPQFPKQSAG